MPPRIDLIGQTFDRLTVISKAPSRRTGTRWNVVCDCGNEKTVFTVSLRSGQTKSCGCLLREGNATKHGESYKTPEYVAWQLMKRRSERFNVGVCTRWQDSYENFLEDMGRRPEEDYSLDRIDYEGDYEPANCRWATKRQQAQNTSANRNITYQGKTKCLTQWAREFKINMATLRDRLNRGWEIEKALTASRQYESTKDKGNGVKDKYKGEYRSWISAKRRCNNPDHMDFKYYGERGIRLCLQWEESFESFLKDMGKRPGPGYSLDRIDPDGNYEPENCRWASVKTQARNRRNNRMLKYKGEERCLAEWVEMLKLPYSRIRGRLRRGWSVPEAFEGRN